MDVKQQQNNNNNIYSAGLGSLVGCMLDWWSGGREFAAPVRPHSFVEIDHEICSTVILSLPLIQEGRLSVTCERMCTEYWLYQPPQEKCGKVNWPSQHDLSCWPWTLSNIKTTTTTYTVPGLVAQSDACSTGDQEVASSRLQSGPILSLRLFMNSFLRSFSPFRWFKKGSC